MASETETETGPDGSFGCVCGKVRVDVVQPKSSTFVTPTAAMCQCTDCYAFASSVANFRESSLPGSSDKADALTPSNAVDMRQIYKSDAVKLVGEENLQAVKLKDDSPCIRYYSTCCGTPLMMNYTMAPFFLVFQNAIKEDEKATTEKRSETSFQRLTPSVVLNHKSAPPDSPPTPEGIPVRDGVSLGFISHAVARAVFGLIGGKKTSPISAQLDSVPLIIGIDSIGTELDAK